MIDLRDHFDRVAVLNLDRFPDRWESFQERAEAAGVTGFARYRAIEGDLAPPPVWWRAGNGAWGCLQSHARVAQDALIDQVARPILVFEDDALFSRDFAKRLPLALDEAAGDYDMAYLGGQHLWQRGWPWRIGLDHWLHAKNLNRTHAMAIHPRFLVKYCQHLLHAPDYIRAGKRHCDHQLGALHEWGHYRILAAQPWLCGQAGGKSWISGRENESDLWWPQPESYILPEPKAKEGSSAA